MKSEFQTRQSCDCTFFYFSISRGGPVDQGVPFLKVPNQEVVLERRKLIGRYLSVVYCFGETSALVLDFVVWCFGFIVCAACWD